MRKYEWDTLKNPRKENGDLGDYHCSLCDCQTGAYVGFEGFLICGGCLHDGIDAINKTILSDLKRNS